MSYLTLIETHLLVIHFYTFIRYSKAEPKEEVVAVVEKVAEKVVEIKHEPKGIYAKNVNNLKSIITSSSLTSPVLNNVLRKPSISPLFGIGSTKNISMHKFITSKGKVASNNSFSPFGSQQNLSSASSIDSDHHHHQQHQSLRAPVIPSFRGDYKGQPVRRNSVSAENKIQEELRDMRAREEELR